MLNEMNPTVFRIFTIYLRKKMYKSSWELAGKSLKIICTTSSFFSRFSTFIRLSVQSILNGMLGILLIFVF